MPRASEDEALFANERRTGRSRDPLEFRKPVYRQKPSLPKANASEALIAVETATEPSLCEASPSLPLLNITRGFLSTTEDRWRGTTLRPLHRRHRNVALRR